MKYCLCQNGSYICFAMTELTNEEVMFTLNEALYQSTLQDAFGWYRHCGYMDCTLPACSHTFLFIENMCWILPLSSYLSPTTMGKRAEQERREAAAAKKRGTSVTANSTSNSTTKSGHSSGANVATASSVKGQKSMRTSGISAQAKPTTHSTRSSPHAYEVTSSGSRVPFLDLTRLI
jgi:hypothetical protein